MKKIGVILSILTVLTLSFITNNNVSAASDISVTYNSAPTVGSDVFPTCTNSSCLSQFSYLIVEQSSSAVSFRVRPIIIYTNDIQSVNLVISPNSAFSVYSLTSNVSSMLFQNSSDLASYDWTSGITFTLTESYQSGITPEGTFDVVANGTYDVTNYASVDVQVEESSFIVQLFSQGFWGVATAIVTIIVPIVALFLVFRLVHDLLWGRG